MNNDRHPTEDQLREFLESSGEDDGIVEHIESCETCEKVMDRLSATSTSMTQRLSQLKAIHVELHGRKLRFDRPHVAELPETHPVPKNTDRYEFDQCIAVGGMGCIYQGFDRKLDRRIAFKVMRSSLSPNDLLTQRFVTEARVCAKLQHPGVVPVYDLAELHDGQPFIAMKLVEGRTLRSWLQTATTNDLSSLLRVFTSLAQTIAYSHNRGIIHRDLKPDNVMIGFFGEVQVMDWGLAKDASQNHGSPSTSSNLPDNDSSGAGTRMGDVIGTPAYMPPEQAAGRLDDLDERADVFALGAILCEILTGVTPYGSVEADIAHRRAVMGNVTFGLEELEKVSHDQELKQLAADCIAASLLDRPRNAEVVGQRISDYLDKLEVKRHQAELQRTRIEVELRESAKRRKTTWALAATLALLCVVASGVGFWRYRDEAQRQRESDRALTTAFHSATEAWNNARLAAPYEDDDDILLWNEALKAIRLAESRIRAESDPELVARIKTTLQDLQGEADNAERLARLTMRSQEVLDELERAALRQMDVDPNREQFSDSTYAAVPHYRNALKLLGITPRQTPVDQALRKVQQYDAELQSQIIEMIDNWYQLSRKRSNPDPDVPWLVELQSQLDKNEFRKRVRKAIVDDRIEDLLKIAGGTEILDESPKTIVFLVRELQTTFQVEAAIKLVRRAYWRYPSDFWLNLKMAMLPKSSKEDVIRYYSACVAARPDNEGARLNLGVALKRAGRNDEAFEQFREICRRSPRIPLAYYWMGREYESRDNFAEAIRYYQKAVEIDPGYVRGHHSIARIYFRLNRLAKANTQIDRGLEYAQRNLVLLHMKASIRFAQKQYVDAEETIDKAIEVDPTYKPALRLKTNLLLRSENWKGAIPFCHQLIQMAPKELAIQANLGLCYYRIGEYEGAVNYLKKGTKMRNYVPIVHVTLARTYAKLNRRQDAISELKRMTKKPITDPRMLLDIGTSFTSLGAYKEALPILKRAHQIGSRSPKWRIDSQALVNDCLRKLEKKRKTQGS